VPLPAPAQPVHAAATLRLAVLQTAATFAAGKALNNDISSSDVLKIADAWARWVKEER
jgi:hypothetical protein